MARPNLSYLKNFILFLLGLPLGLFTGLTGIAASVFVLPAVPRLVGLRAERAVGVGLTVTFFAAFASILSYIQRGEVRGWTALLLVAGQTVGALLAGRLIARFPRIDQISWLWATLVAVGGLALLGSGLGIFAGPQIAAGHSSLPFYGLAVLIAAGVGLVSRVIGLGGVLLVPALIYGLGLPPHTAQGTALVVLASASLPGMLVHARRGAIEPQAATWLSVGAVFGALIGAWVAVARLPDQALILLFGGVLTVLGVLMLFRRDAAG